jgi:hypothetical protein
MITLSGAHCAFHLCPVQNLDVQYVTTVKPVYNGHPWNLKNVVVMQGLSKKASFRLAVLASDWPLWTDGRYAEVVVRTGLTVLNHVTTLSFVYLGADFMFKLILLSECFIFFKTLGHQKNVEYKL